MKVTSSTVTNSFKPVTVMITLETEEEFKSFYQVANYGDQVASYVTERAEALGVKKPVLKAILEAAWETMQAYK